MRHLSALTLAAMLLALPSLARADDKADFFEKRIRPILTNHCIKCHGEKRSENNLRVDSLAALLKGGDIGPAVIPEEPAKSLLILAVQYETEDMQMPPKGRLADQQVADLIRWVKDGAVWPEKKADKSEKKLNEDQ